MAFNIDLITKLKQRMTFLYHRRMLKVYLKCFKEVYFLTFNFRNTPSFTKGWISLALTCILRRTTEDPKILNFSALTAKPRR